MVAELKNQVESLLFSCGRKMDLDEFAVHLSLPKADVIREALVALQQDYDARGGSLMVVEEGTSWKLAVREKYISLVRKINPNTELTKSMMETLAVIAWKQPITQSEVIAIRTNKAYEHIAELANMSFLTKERYGRTYMLKLTQKFYAYFDLQNAQDARKLFGHIKESEETQKKLEEARQQVEGQINHAQVQENKDNQQTGDTMTNENLPEPTQQGSASEDVAPEKQEPTPTSSEDQHQDAIVAHEAEEEITDAADREHMVEDDEISPEEAAFVQGYEQDEDKTQQGE